MPAHGGPRLGAGRKPGQGPFKGGRPVSTRKLRTGMRFQFHMETPEGQTVGDLVEIQIISRKRIELVVIRDGQPTNERWILSGDEENETCVLSSP